MMKARWPLLSLSLIALICTLLATACGQSQAQQPPLPLAPLRNSADLTKLQIKMLAPGNAVPEMQYVSDQKRAQQIYKAALASPQPVPDNPCPAIAGPRYQLVFWAGTRAAEIITADQGGCGDIFLRGGDLRQASQNFWSFLDQAIAGAPLVRQPDHVEIVRYQGDARMPLYAKITSKAQAQALFTTISTFLASSQSTTGLCDDQAASYDDLFFYEGEALYHVQVFSGACSQVRMFGRPPSPFLRPTAQFVQQLNQGLTSVKFAPANPDKLEIEHAPTAIRSGSGPAFTTTRDQGVIQKLYHNAANLPPWPANKDASCNTQGTANSYDIVTFSQGGAWLTSATAFSGCATVSFGRAGIGGGYMRQVTQEFWDLVHSTRSS
ncbi:hypothetical protein KDH_77000 [Dictyobacter sp. S3.2.2.5]|uniref:Sporulation stage II protein D amidase enhancer LytB N-terminal domain-containing protein n=1 Tax=Dictyobacter halimunensis TaxID=3026934 RepID=A0ABQ6G2W6_9CHLR|nr:hypothetical protein KDH_77000 [Dictyobacter sp. S3.2.2.5]